MPRVIINGEMYHYAARVPQADFDQAIIFIHGAGGNNKHWAYQLNDLGEKFLTIALDLPGHGDSKGYLCDNIKEYGDFVHNFAERILGNNFFLVGHSMGGAIAMNFAMRFPEKLNGLILIGTGARLRVAPAILDTFAAGNRFYEFINLAYSSQANVKLINNARDEMKNTEPNVYHKDFLACDRFDYIDQVQNINIPTLIISASEDRLAPVKYSRFLKEKISNSSFKIIEQAGHMMMEENPQQINRIIAEFVLNQ